MPEKPTSLGIFDPPAHSFEIVEISIWWQLFWSLLTLLLVTSTIVYIQIRPDLGKPGGHKVIQARTAMKGVEIAISGFKTEYSRLPTIKASAETFPTRVRGHWLEDLFGPRTSANHRAISFFEPQDARNGKNGLEITINGLPQLKDPWGTIYWALFDLNDDGKIKSPETGSDVIDKRVLIWSAGPDGNHATWEDNVKSWD